MKNKLTKVPSKVYKDSTVLITGAGGTIGSGLCLNLDARTIIALDISEYAIYKLQRQIEKRNIHCIVGDAADKKLIKMIFEKYDIDYVFNAAAYKHVDTLEDENNTYSVVKNNILSTINLCEYMNSLKGFLHISSDKAVYPINNMGYTKLWCEYIVQHYAKQSQSALAKIVRFGNVYESSGSFVETLKWQLSQNIPITITDVRMKRYFLSIDDAVELIVRTSAMKDRGTYILEMGEEINIVDLVKQLNVNNSPVEFIGIRPGEKLNESLIYDYETLIPTQDILINRVEWSCKDISEKLKVLLNELAKDKICLQSLNEVTSTITTL